MNGSATDLTRLLVLYFIIMLYVIQVRIYVKCWSPKDKKEWKIDEQDPSSLKTSDKEVNVGAETLTLISGHRGVRVGASKGEEGGARVGAETPHATDGSRWAVVTRFGA